jgi:hypothetical protein
MTFQDPLSLIPPLLVFELDPGSDLLALISECGNAKETILVLSECVKRSRNALQVEAIEGEEPDSDGDGSYDESASRKKERKVLTWDGRSAVRFGLSLKFILLVRYLSFRVFLLTNNRFA